jgi:hypothetical protein
VRAEAKSLLDAVTAQNEQKAREILFEFIQ